ncbi:cyclic nucleotide-binding domain-containing protein [Pseudanabaenaceae cyanobacterium LEGE 13415]|nr:cyclic nucleotide-binding domain-containing protein [Pseudanabaenaceae cyanobacterium LEGE 13415]
MTSTYAQIEALLPIFHNAYPFNGLSAFICRYLTSRLEVVSFLPGQVIYSEDKPISMIHCLVKGQVQVLGSAAIQSPTLAVLGAGTVIGWERWLRSTTFGSVRVAGIEDPVTTLALRIEHFEQLAVPEVLPVLAEQLSIAELFEVMIRFVERLPTPLSINDLKALIYRIYQQRLAIAYHYLPNTDGSLSPKYQWFMSSNHAIPIGTPIRSLSALSTDTTHQPVRLIGIDRQCLATALKPQSPPPIAVFHAEKEYIS